MRQLFVFIMGLAILGEVGCGGESRPPGSFGDCYAKIKEDMTEMEVNAIASDYPKHREEYRIDSDDPRSKRLRETIAGDPAPHLHRLTATNPGKLMRCVGARR